MNFEKFANGHFALNCIQAFVYLSCSVSSCHYLINRIQFSETGLMPWYVEKGKYSSKIILNRYTDKLFSAGGFILLNSLRLVLISCSILFASKHEMVTLLLVVTTLVSMLIYFRTSLANNEADKFNILLLITLSLTNIVNTNYAVALGLFFIAAQSIFGYFTNGFLKLLEKNWRNGVYLKGILSTKSYSNGIAHFYIKRNGPIYLFTTLSTFVIYWETGFIYCLLLPVKLLLVYLSAGILFHFGISIFMGLSNFLWTFVGTYPAILYCHYVMHRLVHNIM